MTAASGPRVLVHFRRANEEAILGTFAQCIVDYLQGDPAQKETIYVKCSLQEEKLILEKAKSDSEGYLLRHPPFCPIRMMTPPDVTSLPSDISSRGINVGVVAVVEASDERVLVTRRAKHMRTFPGVWVPPGGGIDYGETLEQTVLRELEEETGLQVEQELLSSDVLCLWESVYPPFIDWGQPKRHHIVVYFHLTLKTSSKELTRRIVLCPHEVDAACWLTRKHVAYVMEGKNVANMEQTFQMVLLSEGNEQDHLQCPVDFLTAKAPKAGSNGDVERISSGTRFALSEWLQKKIKSDTKL